MLGALVFLVAMVVVVPVAVMMSGALWSAVFGWLQPATDPSDPEPGRGAPAPEGSGVPEG